MAYISAKIERDDKGEKMTLWGDTYDVKDDLKGRGYKYSNGQWSRKVNNIEAVEDLRLLEERGVQTSVKTEGRGWDAYDLHDVMVYDWQYRRRLEEEYTDGEGD